MKSAIPLFLIVLLMFASCENAKDRLYKQVMAVHDEIMPKMGAIMKYKKQLNKKIDTLIEEGNDANADKIAELTQAIADLDNSHEEMMNWMREFDNDFEGMVNEEVMEYLNNQKDKIENVGKVANSALSNAEKILAK
ncbi:MAG: hypothetical protein KAI29_29225 [Cyclobacteriaceae bacterium]|nr:hypothetical protein [Cyclobacteriaceae bacterium]